MFYILLNKSTELMPQFEHDSLAIYGSINCHEWKELDGRWILGGHYLYKIGNTKEPCGICGCIFRSVDFAPSKKHFTFVFVRNGLISFNILVEYFNEYKFWNYSQNVSSSTGAETFLALTWSTMWKTINRRCEPRTSETIMSDTRNKHMTCHPIPQDKKNCDIWGEEICNSLISDISNTSGLHLFETVTQKPVLSVIMNRQERLLPETEEPNDVYIPANAICKCTKLC